MLETGRMQWLRVSHIMPPNYDILRSPVHCRISEGICDDCLGLIQISERKNDGQVATHLLREASAVLCGIFKSGCMSCAFSATSKLMSPQGAPCSSPRLGVRLSSMSRAVGARCITVIFRRHFLTELTLLSYFRALVEVH